MGKIELIMPKMGESIMEATILNWLKKEGDSVEVDEAIVEIATDKVDSEIPSPVDGIIEKILFQQDAVIPVGTPIAIIASEGASSDSTSPADQQQEAKAEVPARQSSEKVREAKIEVPFVPSEKPEVPAKSGDRFYSPLVRNIAKKEGIGLAELEMITGSGAKGRVTKRDIMAYISNRLQPTAQNGTSSASPQSISAASPTPEMRVPSFSSGNTEIVEMDRMRKMIADHMVMSKHTSPHVTSFVEADVTHIVKWRNNHKAAFEQQYGEKLTYTPIFMEAVSSALKEFPMVNVSVDENKIIVKKDINVGMATALPSGNLIVPVIKNADLLNLAGLAKSVNDLAKRARHNKLKPDDISGGTFTLTNVGTFGNVMGTPIINQPQVAILAVGAIRKKPAVLETEAGDVIAIRSMMFLSLSYDHRVVDGFLGGSFLRRIADKLENFDLNRNI